MQIADSVQLCNIEEILKGYLNDEEKLAVLHIHDDSRRCTIYRNKSNYPVEIDLVLENKFHKNNPTCQEKTFDIWVDVLKIMRLFSAFLCIYFFAMIIVSWFFPDILHFFILE